MPLAKDLPVNQLSKRSITMNWSGFAAVVAIGFIVAILGLAAPAQATTRPNAPTVGVSTINIPATSATTCGSSIFSRMSTSRTGNAGEDLTAPVLEARSTPPRWP